MASYLIVRQKVRDFAAWKPVYDAHAPARAAAGINVTHVLRGADDPNEVIVFGEIADVARAKAFAASDDLREAMQRAGVVDKPDIYFLND
jgi:hypothetical protein